MFLAEEKRLAQLHPETDLERYLVLELKASTDLMGNLHVMQLRFARGASLMLVGALFLALFFERRGFIVIVDTLHKS